MDMLQTFAENEVPLRIFNLDHGEYLFVSNKKSGRDNIVMGHRAAEEPRNHFRVVSSGDGSFQIFNPTYGRYLFVSNDKSGKDNKVEAHPNDEPRNRFEFRDAGDDRFYIYNPQYDKFLFDSNETDGPDHVIYAHGGQYLGEYRNMFVVMLPEPTQYVLKDIQYRIDQAQIVEVPPKIIEVIWLRNESDAEQSLTQAVTISYEQSESWTRTFGTKLGVSAKINAGISVLVNGEISVSGEVSYSYAWGEAHKETLTVQQTITARVPPRSQVEVSYGVRLTRAKVPYTARLKVVHPQFGSEFPVDGVYDGVQCGRVEATYGKPVAI